MAKKGVGGGGASRANPTALRTAGGQRLAGANTVGAAARIRRPRAGGISALLDQARANNIRRARRVARRG